MNEIFKAPINLLLFEVQLSLELIHLLTRFFDFRTRVGTSHSEFRDIYTQEEGTVSFT